MWTPTFLGEGPKFLTEFYKSDTTEHMAKFGDDRPNDQRKDGKKLKRNKQGAYKFGKMKFPEFSRFSRPSEQLFPENYKQETRCNELT